MQKYKLGEFLYFLDVERLGRRQRACYRKVLPLTS